jgi:sec-independent protein translocase protein TatA
METFTGLLLFAPGLPEIMIVLAIILLLFGGRKIPELMKGLGKGMKEFKDAQKDDTEQINEKND